MTGKEFVTALGEPDRKVASSWTSPAVWDMEVIWMEWT